MHRVRKEILPGVFLTCLQTDKFKTGLLSISLLTALTRENAARNAVLPNVLRRGTSSLRNMDAIAARLDSLYGARLEPIVRKRGEIQTVGFWADFVDDAFLPDGSETGLLESVADLMGEMLLSPHTRGGLLLPDYVESEKEKLLDDIRACINDKIAYSRYRLTELMCATEDYGADVLGDEQSAENIRYQSLTRHYKSLIEKSPIEIFYCGTAAAERVEAALKSALATLPRGELDFDIGTDIRMNTLEPEPRCHTEEMAVTQEKLAIGFRLGEAMEEPDFPALSVLNAVYGGSVSSKLFMNVREKLSLCYFASSGLDVMKGILIVISGIDSQNHDAALAEIFRQLEAVKSGDITEEELSSAKAGLMNDLFGLGDSAGALEGYWLTQNLLGSEISPEEQAALIEDVTTEDIKKAAAGISCDMIYYLCGNGESEEDVDDDE